MNKNLTFNFLLLISILFGCNNETDCNLTKLASIKFLKEKCFLLDSATIPDTRSIYYYEENDKKWICFLNEYNNSIYFYNYDNQKLDFIWKSKKNRYKISGFKIINFDSIICNNYFAGHYMIFDSSGVLKDSFNMARNRNIIKYPPASEINSYNAMAKYNNDWTISGHLIGEYKDQNSNNRLVGSIYNKITKKTNYFLSFPSKYQKYNWGGVGFRYVYATLNENANSMIFCFPAEKNLFKYSLKDKNINEISICENYTIKCFTKDSIYLPETKDYVSHFYNNTSYGPIYYNRFKNIYYRIKFLPIENYKFSSENIDQNQKFQVMIYNSNFKYITDTILSNYNPYCVFVSKEGIGFLKKTKTEDKQIFHVFDVDSKNNL